METIFVPLLLFVLSTGVRLGEALQNYRGYKLFNVNAGEELVPVLERLETHGFSLDQSTGDRRVLVDVWAEPHRKRQFAHVLVAPEFVRTFRDAMHDEGFHDLRVLKRDIQKDIDRSHWHAVRSRSRRGRRRIASSNEFKVDEFHNYDEIVDYLGALARDFPEIVEQFDLGSTFEGRRLMGLRVASSVRKFKPAIFIDAGIHAREWIAPASAIFLIHKLVRGYGKDARLTGLVDKFNWFFVPVANPDGYAYTFETDRLWRKTRSRNVTVNKWCVGADANRNWGGRGWGEIGANRSPCSNIFSGYLPFSEPEVLALKNFIKEKVQNLKIYLSLHSYGQLLLSPWGYTSDRPVNFDDQRQAAQLALAAIRNETGATYEHGTIAELMYPASGTSIDYMQDLGVPYIYGIELRPEDREDSFGFTVPKEQIRPTGQELLAAVARMSDYVLEHKMM